METTLEIAGEVSKPATLTFAELAALPGQIADISTLVPGRAGGAVPLKAIVEAAGLRAPWGSSRSEAERAPQYDKPRYITIEAEEGYSASVPLDAVVDQAIVWYRVGDGPVPDKDGGPLRFLIPDVAACKTAEVDACANVKRLRRIVLSAKKGADTRPQTRRQHLDLHDRE